MKIMDIDRSNHTELYYDRAIGNTFRRISESFEQASAGNHVYYIVNTWCMANWTFSKMVEMLYAFFGHSMSSGKQNLIEFPTGGFIKIISQNEWNRKPVPSDVCNEYTIIEMDDTY